MKVGLWLIGLALGGLTFALALGAFSIVRDVQEEVEFFIVRDMRNAQEEIEAWEKQKYQAAPPNFDLPVGIVGRHKKWHVRYPSSRRIQSDPQLIEHFANECRTGREQVDDVHLVNELHVWKGGQNKVFLESADVTHGFFVPVLRLSQVVAPGKVVEVWFKATESNVSWNAETGHWEKGEDLEIADSEHLHAGANVMRGLLLVHRTKEDFLRWLKQAEKDRSRPGPKE